MLESRILVWHQPSAPPGLHTSTAAAWTAATLVASYGSPFDFIMSCHPIYNNLSKSVGPCAVYGSVCQRINTHKTTMVWSRYLLVQHTNGGKRNNCRSFTSLRFNLKVQVEYVLRERKKLLQTVRYQGHKTFLRALAVPLSPLWMIFHQEGCPWVVIFASSSGAMLSLWYFKLFNWREIS